MSITNFWRSFDPDDIEDCDPEDEYDDLDESDEEEQMEADGDPQFINQCDCGEPACAYCGEDPVG